MFHLMSKSIKKRSYDYSHEVMIRMCDNNETNPNFTSKYFAHFVVLLWTFNLFLKFKYGDSIQYFEV